MLDCIRAAAHNETTPTARERDRRLTTTLSLKGTDGMATFKSTVEPSDLVNPLAPILKDTALDLSDAERELGAERARRITLEHDLAFYRDFSSVLLARLHDLTQTVEGLRRVVHANAGRGGA